MKLKRDGVYGDVSPFIKRGGIYAAVSAMLKTQSGYVAAGEASPLPPSYTEWTGANERYGYFSSMVVGVNTPSGFELGRVAPYNLGDVWSISGDTAGLTINANGVISVDDDSLISAAGTRYITVQRINSSGTQQTTIPVLVVDAAGPNMFVDEVEGDDANTGREPHIPKKTLNNAVTNFTNSRTNTYLKRGVTFTGPLQYRTGRKYRSYGDPTLPNPVVAFSAATGMSHAIHPYHNGTKYSPTNSWNIEDIDATGAEIPVRLLQSHLFTIKRMQIRDNLDTANASGIRMSDMTGGGIIRFVSTKRIAGDGIYGTLCRDAHANYEIGYCDFDVPAGAGADSIQFTHENNANQLCYNLWIHHCVGRQDPLSTSLKGSVAIEGTENYLIEDCVFDGKYFAVGANGHKGTVRRVTVPGGRLPTTNGNFGNTWGIGIGSQFLASRLSFYDNVIDGGGVSGVGLNTGLLISGYNLTGLNAERWNIEANNNIIRRVVRSVRTTIPWSGAVRYNTALDNTNNTIINNGAVATQGVATQTVVENLHPLSLPAEPGVASIVGIIEEGQTVSVTANRPVTGYQWRLNGIPISGAISQSFTIPTGYSTSIDERKPVFGGLNAPELSCVVFFADGSTSAPTVRGIAAQSQQVIEPFSIGTISFNVASLDVGIGAGGTISRMGDMLLDEGHVSISRVDGVAGRDCAGVLAALPALLTTMSALPNPVIVFASIWGNDVTPAFNNYGRADAAPASYWTDRIATLNQIADLCEAAGVKTLWGNDSYRNYGLDNRCRADQDIGTGYSNRMYLEPWIKSRFPDQWDFANDRPMIDEYRWSWAIADWTYTDHIHLSGTGYHMRRRFLASRIGRMANGQIPETLPLLSWPIVAAPSTQERVLYSFSNAAAAAAIPAQFNKSTASGSGVASRQHPASIYDVNGTLLPGGFVRHFGQQNGLGDGRGNTGDTSLTLTNDALLKGSFYNGGAGQQFTELGGFAPNSAVRVRYNASAAFTAGVGDRVASVLVGGNTTAQTHIADEALPSDMLTFSGITDPLGIVIVTLARASGGTNVFLSGLEVEGRAV